MKKTKRLVLLYDKPRMVPYHTINGKTTKHHDIGSTIPIWVKRKCLVKNRYVWELCLGVVESSDNDNYYIIIPDDYNTKATNK